MQFLFKFCLGVYCVLVCVLWGNTYAWGVRTTSNAVS